MLYPVNNVGEFGVISDREPFELPENVWSSARNVRFANGYAEAMQGQISVFGTPSVAPYFSISLANDTTNFWLYAGANKVYCWDGGTHSNITRQTTGVDVDYAMDEFHGWNGGVLSGVAIINNGIDTPQAWVSPSAGAKLVNLPNWPANTTAKSVRVFKQFLIALDIDKSGSRYPHLIKWSHPAESGAVPISWDEADPTKLAGESAKCAETPGFIVDGLALRDTFVVYKEDSVWGMQVIQSTQDVFRIYKIFSTGGILSTNCAVEFFNGKHAVFGISDIYQHDGQQMVSIVSEKVRKYIYGTIDGDNYRKCHVAHNPNRREVWFAYPTNGSDFCDEALIWNYESNTVSFRELPQGAHIATGIVNPASTLAASDQWDLDTQVWEDDTTKWNERLYNPTQFNLLLSSPVNTKLFLMDYSNSNEGVGMLRELVRIGLPLPLVSSKPPDISYRKFVRRIWLRITGSAGKVVKISVGVQLNSFDAVFWENPCDYTIGASQYVDVRTNGRLIAIKLQTTEVMTWQLHGYEVEYEPMGRL